MKVKKRPDTFEAIQFDPSPEGLKAVSAFFRRPVNIQYQAGGTEPLLLLEGGRAVCAGDWLVRGRCPGVESYSPLSFEAAFEVAE